MTGFPVYTGRVKPSNTPLKVRAKRGKNGPFALDPPTIVGVSFRPNNPDNMVPVGLLGAALTVQIQNQAQMIAGVEVQLTWDGNDFTHLIGAKKTITAVEEGDYTLIFDFEIDPALFPSDNTFEVHQLGYFVGYEITGTGEFSALIPITFDRIVPGSDPFPGILEFTDEQISGITLDDLNANDELEVTAAAWYDMRVGDVLTPWLGTSTALPDGKFLAPMPAITATDVGKSVVVKFALADMVALGNVDQHFGYRLVDRADNTSVRSSTVHVGVLLDSPPSSFLAPVVPAFDDHGLVIDDDARPPGVEIEIPLYTNPAVGDKIIVNWGGVVMPEATLDPSHITPTPSDPLIAFNLPYRLVLSAGRVNPALQVTYDVRVGNVNAGRSPPATIAVDLTTPGGVTDPDIDTPEHEDLGLVTVKSDNGNGADNEIPAGDYAKPAVITVPRLGVMSGNPVWLVNDQVTVTWGTIELAMVTITAANAGADLPVTITAAQIDQMGAGTINVKYRISRPLSVPPNLGTAYSYPRVIPVRSSADLPNDGNPLPVVDFVDKALVGGFYYIQRAVGVNGAEIHIDLTISNVAKNDTIDIRFVGLGNHNQFNDPLLPEDPATVHTMTHSITDVELAQQYAEVRIPAQALFKVCLRGSTTTYTITNANGTTNSLPTFMNIAVWNVDPALACIWPIPNP